MSSNVNANNLYSYQANVPQFGAQTQAFNGARPEIVNDHPLASAAPESLVDLGTMAKWFLPTYGALYGSSALFNWMLQAENYKKTILNGLGWLGDKIAGNKLYDKTIGATTRNAKELGTWAMDTRAGKYIKEAFSHPVSPAFKLPADQMKHSLLNSVRNAALDSIKIVLKGQGKTDVEIANIIKDLETDLETKTPKQCLEKLQTYLCNLKGGSPTQAKKINPALNKIKAALGKGRETGLGRGLSKFPMYVADGFGTLSHSKLGPLLLAVLLSMEVGHAFKREKGDKLPALAENLISWPAFVATMGMATLGFYSVAGLKYLGCDPQKVKRFQALVKKANKLNQEGKLTKEQHKKWVKRIKRAKSAALKPLEKRPWYQKAFEKPIRMTGKVLSFGLDRVRTWKKPLDAKHRWFHPKNISIRIGNIARRMTKLHCYPGTALRFGLLGLVVMPMFTKPFTAIGHIIFGKPKEEGAQEAQEAQQIAELPPQSAVVPQIAKGLNVTPVTPSSLLDKNNRLGSATIPSTPLEPSVSRRYIPSPKATNFEPEKHELTPEQKRLLAKWDKKYK